MGSVATGLKKSCLRTPKQLFSIHARQRSEELYEELYAELYEELYEVVDTSERDGKGELSFERERFFFIS